MIARFRLKTALYLLLPVVLVASLWGGRAALLRHAAHLWVISDTPVRADAIVVLGGGVYPRSRVAAQLFHRGFAPRILITNPRPRKIESLNIVIDDVPLTRKVLESEGVPPSVIQLLEPNVNNTFDEATVLAAWAHQHNAHKFLVPTDVFHTRRVRWAFQHQLQFVNAEVRVVSVENEHFTLDNWWQVKEGPKGFQNEALKYLIYLLRY